MGYAVTSTRTPRARGACPFGEGFGQFCVECRAVFGAQHGPDPPLHEFLPHYTDLAVQVALHDERSAKDTKEHQFLEAVKRLHERTRCLVCALAVPRTVTFDPELVAWSTSSISKATSDGLTSPGSIPYGDVRKTTLLS